MRIWLQVLVTERLEKGVAAFNCHVVQLRSLLQIRLGSKRNHPQRLVNDVNQNYNFLQFSQDFSREKYCVFLFGKLRGCSPGVPRAYLKTSALAH